MNGRAETIATAILEWYGPKTRAEIAEGLSLSLGQLDHIWKSQKAKGVLPADDPRPAFVLSASIAQREALAGDDDADDRDALPIVPGHDRLLIALQRAHGNDPRRAFDDLRLHPRTDRIVKETA